MNLQVLIILLGSMVGTAFVLPKIVGIARYKELLDKPNHRSSHTNQVPRLGGIAFYITLMLAFYFMQRSDQSGLFNSIAPCLTILFIVGLKDDLVVVSARTKFIAQILVGTFLIFDPELEIRSLHGFLNFYSVEPFISIVLFYIIITGLINAVNLVDGIDGLATGLGISMLSSLAFFFFIAGKEFSFLFMLSMIGILIAFLPFNLSKNRKIFMGDTGSMILGFVLAYGCIRILTLETGELYNLGIPLANIPFLLVFITFIPVADTLRVMTMRVLKKKSPFHPDRTHLHHYFLDRLNWSHKRTSLFISLSGLAITVLGYIACKFLHYSILISFMAVCYAALLYVSFRLEKKSKAERKTMKKVSVKKILEPEAV